MQEEFGYQALTLRPRQPRSSLCRPDGIDRLREAQGGVRVGRSLRAYGPRSRREFLALLRHEVRGAG